MSLTSNIGMCTVSGIAPFISISNDCRCRSSWPKIQAAQFQGRGQADLQRGAFLRGHVFFVGHWKIRWHCGSGKAAARRIVPLVRWTVVRVVFRPTPVFCDRFRESAASRENGGYGATRTRAFDRARFQQGKRMIWPSLTVLRKAGRLSQRNVTINCLGRFGAGSPHSRVLA